MEIQLISHKYNLKNYNNSNNMLKFVCNSIIYVYTNAVVLIMTTWRRPTTLMSPGNVRTLSKAIFSKDN